MTIRFLVGFGVLWAVLAGLAELDATGRYGVAILATVLLAVLVVERLLGSFRAAVGLTMPLVAATHIPVLVTSGPVVGMAAIFVAAVTTLPLAHLCELGRGTIWAPALVHAGIDSVKLVELPAATLTTFSLILAAISVTVPLPVLAVPVDRQEVHQ